MKTSSSRFWVTLFAVALGTVCSANLSAQSYDYHAGQNRIAKRLLLQDPVRLDSQDGIELQTDDADERGVFELEQDSAGSLEMDERLDERRPQRPAFGPWPAKGIRGIKIDIRERSTVAPEDRSAQLINGGGQGWTQFAPAPKVFAWSAPNIRYQPLYFEDVPLERYGQSARPIRQGMLSYLNFATSTSLLGLKMLHDPPSSCDYSFGFCRPGNTVPYTIQRQYYGRLR